MKIRHASIALIGLVTAACGGGSGSNPPAVNQAPTITAIADQSTAANVASQAIAFSIDDEDVAGLSIGVSSDNQAVIADAGIAVMGTGTQRSLGITPVIDTTGDAFLTVLVTDSQGLSASTSFLLTVNPQQGSIQQFTRAEFVELADDEPALINAVEFAQDAEEDDFEDLLAQ